MNCFKADILFQEVPGEVSLGFMFSGCPLRCKGCHSSDAWKHGNGKPFNAQTLQGYINKYISYITCVLFLGGEWEEEFEKLLDTSLRNNLKTCLYTGLNDVDSNIKSKLNYLKTGPWIPELGGLDKEETNQKFINLKTNEDLTHMFRGNKIK